MVDEHNTKTCANTNITLEALISKNLCLYKIHMCKYQFKWLNILYCYLCTYYSSPLKI